MKNLAEIELNSIEGGWDWDDFAAGLSVGLGVTAVVLATGGGVLIGPAAIVAWTGVAAGVAGLYL